MALAANAERVVVARTRTHGEAVGGAARSVSSTRSLVKRTSPLAEGTVLRPLELVPRRKRNARVVALAVTMIFAIMLGAAAFQTQLARRQVVLDSIDRRIRAGQEQYEVLRRERAELRSPGRLEQEALALGMSPATRTEFVSIDPTVVATVQRAGADGVDRSTSVLASEFAQYAIVKSQTESAP